MGDANSRVPGGWTTVDEASPGLPNGDTGMGRRERENMHRLLTTWHKPVQTLLNFYDRVLTNSFLFVDVTNEINNQIATDRVGRMFAIVQVCGKQFKVTEHDIIIIEGFWPPNIGDQLKLEKVLLVGSKDFTLIGRPILNRELVSIDATVIEKTLSHTKTRFRFRPRKQYRRINCKIPKRISFFHSSRFNYINLLDVLSSSLQNTTHDAAD